MRMFPCFYTSAERNTIQTGIAFYFYFSSPATISPAYRSEIKPGNVREIAQGGQQPWKIGNEGFNTQKNGGYGLENVFFTVVLAGWGLTPEAPDMSLRVSAAFSCKTR
ncbi:MAG: hypothetical protein ACRD1R_04685 [Acidobacteriota bacterium]